MITAHPGGLRLPRIDVKGASLPWQDCLGHGSSRRCVFSPVNRRNFPAWRAESLREVQGAEALLHAPASAASSPGAGQARAAHFGGKRGLER